MIENAQKVKDILDCLQGVVPAFESSLINSADYRDKAMAVHRSMSALAQMHPNWSEEGNVVIGGDKEGVPPLDESDPLVNIYVYSEELFHAWNKMSIVRPSIRALADGCAEFRTALTKLQNECSVACEPRDTDAQ